MQQAHPVTVYNPKNLRIRLNSKYCTLSSTNEVRKHRNVTQEVCINTFAHLLLSLIIIYVVNFDLGRALFCAIYCETFPSEPR